MKNLLDMPLFSFVCFLILFFFVYLEYVLRIYFFSCSKDYLLLFTFLY